LSLGGLKNRCIAATPHGLQHLSARSVEKFLHNFLPSRSPLIASEFIAAALIYVNLEHLTEIKELPLYRQCMFISYPRFQVYVYIGRPLLEHWGRGDGYRFETCRIAAHPADCVDSNACVCKYFSDRQSMLVPN